ncbi:MAG: malonyl-ACP O-methyltransferase BioC [Salinivirgaceae bacterium]|nr:malonyl-ACP O-methyltransferase BioC [Salinivirgaceae bacterium]
MIIADKKIIKERFNRNFASYQCGAIVQKKVVERFCQILHELKLSNFSKVLEIGCGTGFLSKEFLKKENPHQYFLNDLNTEIFQGIKNTLNSKLLLNYQYLSGDAELIDFPDDLDALISTSTIQWFHKLENFIRKVNYHLVENGIFAFSTFGQQNFIEIKETLKLGLDYYSKTELVEMLSEKFDILHFEEWKEAMLFENPREVLRHIKTTGVNGISNYYWSKTKLLQFEESYINQFKAEDKVRLTYHPIIIIARKK